MTEQIGLAVAHESPAPAFTDEGGWWFELAAHQREVLARLRAENADLRTKLAAANTELHELRIKASSLQSEPDWSQAPQPPFVVE